MNYTREQPLMLESDYPYEAQDGACRYDPAKGVLAVDHYEVGPQLTVQGFKETIAKGPIAQGICTLDKVLFTYESGIFNPQECCTDALSHLVTAVGYGVEDGKEYAILRNAFGASWGEKGYMRIALNEDGMGVCGILRWGARPVMP